MKTQIIKLDGREGVDELEYVNILNMNWKQFMALCSCIEAAKASNCQRVRKLVNELHVTTHWKMDWKNKIVSLCFLTWEDVMVLAAILSDEIDRLKDVPMNHWYRDVAQSKREHIAKILEALNLTFEARVE